jgi:formylglycine-generating enzyme required for sulfatase activity
MIASVSISFAVFARPAVVPANHSEKTACFDCHTDLKHPVLQGVFANECETCHDKRDIEEKLVLATADETKFTTSAVEARNNDTRDLPLGLSVPMYSEISRMGDAPNEMIRIPAGEFIMGTDERLSDEGPQHTVFLKDYFIDKFEVTNLQYKKFIDATRRKSPSHFENRTYPDGKADHPVTFVSWDDANAYCEWAGKRLPTDEEWEKAARGTDGRMFPWGNKFALDKANMPLRWQELKQDGDTSPVGAFPAGVSPYGVFDMSGNVWEWTSSWYEAYPGNTHRSENYGKIYKTLKGGSWWDCSFYKCGISAPSFNRSFFISGTKNKSFGFRCAKDG